MNAATISLDEISKTVKHPNFKDIAGKKFGMLIAIKPVGYANNGQIRWLCKCDCGVEKVFSKGNLYGSAKHSCGCHCGRYKHGCSTEGNKTSEYYIWQAMIGRCTNPNDKGFANYGGRGIKVCDRWRNSFSSFLSDMGIKPTKSHCIERVNNNGNYEPDNCVWATRIVQANNTRSNRLIEYRGDTKPLTLWCRELNLIPKTITQRMTRGMSARDAFEKPCSPFKYYRKAKPADLPSQTLQPLLTPGVVLETSAT